ncbi:MAG: hypothetical protein ACUZ8H_16340 [Candidatus Anammoxibacter sp.]
MKNENENFGFSLSDLVVTERGELRYSFETHYTGQRKVLIGIAFWGGPFRLYNGKQLEFLVLISQDMEGL